MRTDKWIQKNTASLSGKRVAISGSTGGIGRELCRHLAGLGASLVMIDRNAARSLSLAEDLKCEFPDLKTHFVKADMSDIDSVKNATEQLLNMDIDYLILNAGAYSIPRYKTSLGYDNVFTINFVSPYYMARRLLPSVKSRGGRIVAVGSIAHNYSRIDTEDIDFSGRKQASLVYGNAKRYLTYSLFALDGQQVSIAHPGICFTGITNHYPPLIFALIKHPMKIIFMSPRRASLSILSALFSECGAGRWIGPRFFDIWGLPKKKPLRTATDSEAQKIAEIAEKIYQNVK
jgi:NAD(P)-dependent dehydrogenase (short-subunit alcohol dehydrogenase family)